MLASDPTLLLCSALRDLDTIHAYNSRGEPARAQAFIEHVRDRLSPTAKLSADGARPARVRARLIPRCAQYRKASDGLLLAR